MKFIHTIIILTTIQISVQAQEVLILNKQNEAPVENVIVFNKNYSKVVYTNSNGKADLKDFNRKDSVFFKHPSIELFGLKYQDIADLDYILFIDKRSILMEDIIVTASRWQEKKRDVPFMTDVIRLRDSKLKTAQTTSDVLSSTGNLMIQKSQGGAGSPVIRGFEANRLLLVVDGVRMNNAIYRSGHLQNSMSLDLGGLDKIEIIYGPSSVIYGSDALGGVIHYYTKTPELAIDKKTNLRAEASTQFSTANRAFISHFGLNAGFRKTAFYTSFTQSSFGDIRMGKNRNPFLDNHGKLFYKTLFRNNTDTVVPNNHPDVQLQTGYKQYDFTQKVLVVLNNHIKLIGNIQYSTSSRINRYDELSVFNGGIPSYASWYYGPQNRFFSSLKFISEAQGRLFTDFSAIVAYQKIDEDRINRKFKRNNELHQEEDVDVFSLNLDFRKAFTPQHKLEYGIEATYNEVGSDGYNVNILTGSVSDALSRYPDKGSYFSKFAGYTGYKWNPSAKVLLSTGFRYSYMMISSRFSPEYDMIPFSAVDISAGALTGNGSIIYNPRSDLKLSFILSTGYRSPNVDDYGKVRAKDQEVTLPNNRLEPEYAYNAEAGVMKTFNSIVSAGANVYYTYLTQAIVRTFSTFNGQDSLNYNGDMYRIITNTNSDRAYITGFSLFMNVEFNKELHLKNTFNYTKGWDISNDVPLAHIPPVFGRSSFTFNRKAFYSECYVEYHGWKRAKDYSPTSEDNLNAATEYGSPSWATVNINSSVAMGQHVRLQLAVENIFDTYYRVFASGVSAPGRNFIITLKATI